MKNIKETWKRTYLHYLNFSKPIPRELRVYLRTLIYAIRDIFVSIGSIIVTVLSWLLVVLFIYWIILLCELWSDEDV